MSGAHNRWNTTPLPLFANDFLNGTSELSDQAVGRYIRLLCYQWLKGSVPADPGYTADLQIFIPAEADANGYADGCASRAARAKMILDSYFEVEEGRARNRRLEADREKVRGKSRKAKDAATKRWEKKQLEEELRLSGELDCYDRCYADSHADATPNADADKMPPSPSPSPTTTSVGEASASPTTNVELRTVLSYPCRGNPKQWALTEEQVGKWKALYPGLDVVGCCRKALAWCEANPKRCKTAKGMPKFLVNWINNEVDRGTSRLEESNGYDLGPTDLAGRPETDRLCRLHHGDPVGSDEKHPKYRDILALARLAAEVGIGEAWERRLKPPVLVTEKPPPLCAHCEDAYANEDHECNPPEVA